MECFTNLRVMGYKSEFCQNFLSTPRGGTYLPDGGGGTYSQVWMGGYPVQLQVGGVPCPAPGGGEGGGGTLVGGGVPQWGEGGTPVGTPPIRTAWTCYAAVGEPLAC